MKFPEDLLGCMIMLEQVGHVLHSDQLVGAQAARSVNLSEASLALLLDEFIVVTEVHPFFWPRVDYA